MVPFLKVDEVIDRALMLIRLHPLFKDPVCFNGAGQPLRITKMRNFDGLDTNATGLTLSLFPYAYMGTSNETTTSQNVGLSFRPYTLNGKDSGFDIATLTLVAKISIQGREQSTAEVVTAPHKVIYERSMREVALYQWLPVLRSILLTNPISDLAGLVANSTVNWGSFRSVAWDKGPGSSAGGENAVFHSASLLWSIDFFAPRNWREYAQSDPRTDSEAPSSWQYLGVRTIDCEPVYYDWATKKIVSLAGFPLVATPKGVQVTFDEDTETIVRVSDGEPLTNTEMQDPRTDPVNQPWINTNLLLVGYINDLLLFWNLTATRLEHCDGTVVTQLPDGTPITYDPGTSQVINTGTGQPLPSDGVFTGFGTTRVNIYTANGLVLRDTFKLT